jgi:hypothetical protein
MGWFWRPKDEPLLVAPEPTEPLDAGRRAEIATRLLQDPVLNGVFEEIHDDACRLWLATKPSEVERREELYRAVKASDLVRAKLQIYRSVATIRAAERQAS